MSSEVEAMEQSSEPDQLALLALGTTAALVLFLKLLQRGRARKVLAALLDLCKNVLVFSSSAFFFPVTGQACKSKWTGRVLPESTQMWLNILLQRVLLPKCISWVCVSKKDISGIYVPPPNTVACEHVSIYT